MQTDLAQDGLIVNSSSVPILRAGYANLIIVPLVVGLILINQALTDLATFQIVKWILLLSYFLLMLAVYTHSVSKIVLKNGTVVAITGPCSVTEIAINEISHLRIYGIPSSMTIILKIGIKSAVMPTFLFFVAVSTNYGSYSETRNNLYSLFGCNPPV